MMVINVDNNHVELDWIMETLKIDNQSGHLQSKLAIELLNHIVSGGKVQVIKNGKWVTAKSVNLCCADMYRAINTSRNKRLLRCSEDSTVTPAYIAKIHGSSIKLMSESCKKSRKYIEELWVSSPEMFITIANGSKRKPK